MTTATYARVPVEPTAESHEFFTKLFNTIGLSNVHPMWLDLAAREMDAHIAAAAPPPDAGEVERLRAEVDRLTVKCAHEIERGNKAEATVERLTRERDEAVVKYADELKVSARLREENTRQASEIGRYMNDPVVGRLTGELANTTAHLRDAQAQLVESKARAEGLTGELAEANTEIDTLGKWRAAGNAAMARAEKAEALLAEKEKGKMSEREDAVNDRLERIPLTEAQWAALKLAAGGGVLWPRGKQQPPYQIAPDDGLHYQVWVDDCFALIDVGFLNRKEGTATKAGKVASAEHEKQKGK